MKIRNPVLSPGDGVNLAVISHRCEDQVKCHQLVFNCKGFYNIECLYETANAEERNKITLETDCYM